MLDEARILAPVPLDLLSSRKWQLVSSLGKLAVQPGHPIKAWPMPMLRSLADVLSENALQSMPAASVRDAVLLPCMDRWECETLKIINIDLNGIIAAV